MKILDRYILRSFLLNYVISFVVLIGMYIVLDMVFNFDELVSAKEAARLTTLGLIGQIADHYFHQMFLIFVHLSGVIPVVAAGFTLIRLSRFNELSAIMAAGIDLRRFAMPIIISAVVLQGLLAVDQELIIPNIIPKLMAKHEEIYTSADNKWYPIQAMQDGHGGLLFAARFYPSGIMADMDVIERNDDLQPVAHTKADAAEWDAKRAQWKLTRGKRISGLLPKQAREERPIAVYKSDVTPEEIALYHSSEFVNLLSREKINQLIEHKQVYGTMDLLRVKHFRLSQLVMNIVMLLVAIPCVLTRDPGRLKMSIFQCLVLVGLCMSSYFLAFQIAGFPPTGTQWADRWPAIWAAAPIMVFGPVAVFLLDRLPT